MPGVDCYAWVEKVGKSETRSLVRCCARKSFQSPCPPAQTSFVQEPRLQNREPATFVYGLDAFGNPAGYHNTQHSTHISRLFVTHIPRQLLRFTSITRKMDQPIRKLKVKLLKPQDPSARKTSESGESPIPKRTFNRVEKVKPALCAETPVESIQKLDVFADATELEYISRLRDPWSYAGSAYQQAASSKLSDAVSGVKRREADVNPTVATKRSRRT
ncbi:hypothetical protein BJ508DRAFT_122667 [Ascobolus immersus RN42]|uniref:Uncharacterized protein n=1 Tax=Ascobolus immersus RN42 TaxID=1160509 RepID=A0A3N4I5W5_ASCIM|nr:hypothetical protein BJ508DRAFT_122667 [Ascobolus immersus RN42]